ncbi:unnamed protein product [Rhizophagus irregularis]|nr:unnamed protein product [Rhizophagus irregularis]
MSNSKVRKAKTGLDILDVFTGTDGSVILSTLSHARVNNNISNIVNVYGRSPVYGVRFEVCSISVTHQIGNVYGRSPVYGVRFEVFSISVTHQIGNVYGRSPVFGVTFEVCSISVTHQ